MTNNHHPRFHIPCDCLKKLESKLRETKMMLPGITRWSDKDGSAGVGAIFTCYGPPRKGKVAGGLVKFRFCPLCGKSFIDDGLILTDGGNDDTRKN